MAEDQGKEEEKFDFTPEGEGYISLDEARVLAMRTAVESPGNYGSAYQGVDMVFDVVESTETDDHYNITLSFRPQGSFDGTPGQEQFVIGKDGTIAVRQVLSSIVRKGGGFPLLPVAIGVVIVGAIAAVGAVVILMSSGGDNVPIAAVVPTETPAPTQPPAPTETLAPTEAPAPPMATHTLPTARVIVVTPTFTPEPKPTATPNAFSHYSKAGEYRRAENWAMAVGEYTTAIQKGHDYALAYFHRAYSYHFLGKHQNAIEDLTVAIQRDSLRSNHALAYNNRGIAYKNLGQDQNAINDYTKAIQIGGSNDAMAYNNRGIAYRILGQTANADADKAKACSLDSKYC